MRLVLKVSLIAGLLTLAVVPSYGQFSFAQPGGQGQAPQGETPRTGSITLYPVAYFNLNAPGSGTTSRTGLILAGEKALGSFPRAGALGGWYYTGYNSDQGRRDLYEIHGKDYFTRHVGVQIGTLGSTVTSGQAYDAFLLGNFGSAPMAPRVWGVQAGIGPFVDTSGNLTTTDVTAFISGSLGIRKNLSIDASYWYVRDRSADNSRIAIGVGYKI